MPSLFKLFGPPRHPVLSLSVHALPTAAPREQPRFEVLVRHLLYRFFHNELLASDDETKRILQIAYAVALPGLLLAMFLFPSYHAFPPYPVHRPFWPQVGDHYFYVMYSFVVMGAATVYEWDLLFPDLLDVFVLSILPIANNRLFFARVLALTIFLAVVLLGTSLFGIIAFPAVADLANPGRHLLAHTVAVIMSGTFAASFFLALQGILLNTVGERLFRRITPLLQGGSLMILLTVLLLYPTLSRSLQPLLFSHSLIVRCFPPLWFLGVYEQLLTGPSVLPVFREAAHTACYALLVVLAMTVATYPLAYRRRVRQIIEGARATTAPNRTILPLHGLLHATMLPIPAGRAMFHFISQTVLRSQRHRVMLAMYGGLGISLALANMVVFSVHGSSIRPQLLPTGIRAAVPIITFWTVIGLRSALAAPIDRRGSWLFRVLVGRPRSGLLEGNRMWVTLCAGLLGLATAIVLHFLSPPSLQIPVITAGQAIVATGSAILLADVLLFGMRTVPFTHLRKSSITDFPLMILRYGMVFPAYVFLVVHYEPQFESSIFSLIGIGLVIAGSHMVLLHLHARSVQASTLDVQLDDEDEFPQRLGLVG
jgi:hypothetical protein